jgi:CheY-like chemotaxis protein
MPDGFNILAVDDSENDIFLLREAFKKAGILREFQTAHDGLEAVAYLKGEGRYRDRTEYPFPDLILLDLNMPRLSGFEVLQWIRQNPDSCLVAVHVMSTSSRRLDAERAYQLGANSYVIKPPRLDGLVDFATALHLWHRFAYLPAGGVSAQPQDARP